MKIRLIIMKISSTVVFVVTIITHIFGQNTDSLSLAKESPHFTFYSAKSDEGVLDTLATTLENNFSRITKRLGIQFDRKIKVKVFPDVNAFHAAINYPDAPDWVVGTLSTDELLIVSPLNPGSSHTYKSLIQVLVHEFTHFAVYQAVGEKGTTNLPRWLNEGYAQYEAGQINEHIRKYVKSGLEENPPPTWTQLDTVSIMEFGSMKGYGFSVMIVEYLIDTYGIDKLALLIKKPEDFESIYGLPKDELEKQWVLFLKK